MYSFLGHKHLLDRKKKLPEYPAFSAIGSYAQTTGTVTVINVPYPSTINANDIILMIVSKTTWDYNMASSGWTKITHRAYPDTHVFWKRATGSESGTAPVTLAAVDGITRAYMITYSGCIETGTPWESVGTTSGGGSTLQINVYYHQRCKAIGVFGTVLNSSFALQYSVPALERFEKYSAPGNFVLEYDVPDDYATNPPTYPYMRVYFGGTKEAMGILFYLKPKE
jgi:hypothetical protein